LIDALGRVVGITTLASSTGFGSTANGLGFAISTAELLPEMKRLRDDASGAAPQAGYLGVQLERRTDGGSGALVGQVVHGSGADKAGIQVGDVVVAVNGQPITGQAALIATIRDLAPGDKAAVSLTRDGKPLDVDVVLGARPPNS
jgi:S1-C subfamily serine protease